MSIRIENASQHIPQQETLGQRTCHLLVPGLAFVGQPTDPTSEGILSLVVGCDLRADCIVKVVDSLGNVHQLNAGFASHGQRLRIPWASDCKQLVVLEIQGPGQLWIVTEGVWAPRIIPLEQSVALRREAALDRLRHDALCQFSWMGGCVLDGMWQLSQAVEGDAWNSGIRDWLCYYIKDSKLQYQSPRGDPIRNRFINIEGTLPVAVIARLDPWHPVCGMAMKMFDELVPADGRSVSGGVTAEGCYTVAYPLAVLAKVRDDGALAERAFRQLELRREYLFHDAAIYLRHREGEADVRSFRNWTRGICWYLLGYVRCFLELGVEQRPDLCEHFQERASWIQSYQRQDGLWGNFLNETGYPPDSSGSCGIATALAVGHSLGLLDVGARDCAVRCWEGVASFLEPDGWLGCVAPNNKRGEAAQHTHARTIEPFALGLYAQLAAALSRPANVEYK